MVRALVIHDHVKIKFFTISLASPHMISYLFHVVNVYRGTYQSLLNLLVSVDEIGTPVSGQ